MTNSERTGFEQKIAALLRTGVAISAAVVFSGGVCRLIQARHEIPAYHVFHQVPERYENVFRILTAARTGDCQAVIQLGLLLLIATPVARVAFSVFMFARERDRTYVVVTLAVLAILLFSLFR